LIDFKLFNSCLPANGTITTTSKSVLIMDIQVCNIFETRWGKKCKNVINVDSYKFSKYIEL